MTKKEINKSIRKRIVLIGLSFINDEGVLIEQYQTHGFIEELTDTGILRILRADKTIFQIPYDAESLIQAEPGDYRERTTGIVIKDPDFIISWEIIVGPSENLDEIKRFGYIAPKA